MDSAGMNESSCLTEGLDRCTFLQKLQTRGDHFFSRFEAGENGIGVADGFAHCNRHLVRDVTVTFGRGDVDEGLAAYEADSKDRDSGSRRCAPGDSGLDQLLVTKELSRARDICLGEDALQTVVNLWREEVDGRFGENIACCVDNRDRESLANLRGSLGGDVDVGFEV